MTNDEQQTPAHSNPELLQAYQARVEEIQELKNTIKRLQNIIAMFRTEERNRALANKRSKQVGNVSHLKSVEVSQDSRAYQSKGDSDD